MIDVVPAQPRVAVGRQNLENTGVQPQDGHVERAAAEVVHRDQPFLFGVQAIGQRRRGRFVEKTDDVQTGQSARVLGGLALRVVEIRRDRDDGFEDVFAERSLGLVSQGTQNQGRYFGRGDLPVVDRKADRTAHVIDETVTPMVFDADVFHADAHESLDGPDRGQRLRARQFTGLAAHNDPLVVEKTDDGRDDLLAGVRVGQHPRAGIVHAGDQAVGRPQIYADYAFHD